jgi:hypothetical protein
MPLNEATAPPSNLTKQQKKDALAAIYGAPGDLTEFDIAKIRRQLREDAEPSTEKPPPE